MDRVEAITFRYNLAEAIYPDLEGAEEIVLSEYLHENAGKPLRIWGVNVSVDPALPPNEWRVVKPVVTVPSSRG
jgi:hypothetical protein